MRIKIEAAPFDKKNVARTGAGVRIFDLDSGVSLAHLTRDITVRLPVDDVVTAHLEVYPSAVDMVAELRSIELVTPRLQRLERFVQELSYRPDGELKDWSARARHVLKGGIE